VSASQRSNICDLLFRPHASADSRQGCYIIQRRAHVAVAVSRSPRLTYIHELAHPARHVQPDQPHIVVSLPSQPMARQRCQKTGPRHVHLIHRSIAAAADAKPRCFRMWPSKCKSRRSTSVCDANHKMSLFSRAAREAKPLGRPPMRWTAVGPIRMPPGCCPSSRRPILSVSLGGVPQACPWVEFWGHPLIPQCPQEGNVHGRYGLLSPLAPHRDDVACGRNHSEINRREPSRSTHVAPRALRLVLCEVILWLRQRGGAGLDAKVPGLSLLTLLACLGLGLAWAYEADYIVMLFAVAAAFAGVEAV